MIFDGCWKWVVLVLCKIEPPLTMAQYSKNRHRSRHCNVIYLLIKVLVTSSNRIKIKSHGKQSRQWIILPQPTQISFKTHSQKIIIINLTNQSLLTTLHINRTRSNIQSSNPKSLTEMIWVNMPWVLSFVAEFCGFCVWEWILFVSIDCRKHFSFNVPFQTQNVSLLFY